ncbi:Anaerobic dimethyl sulfoxide reductase chain B [Planctomycetes bacterium CA13]|uniref:Anaerobic dimethyl sulfoxide reductase chain B n=1 Tax=Novipirellula herctigrandis TaxID=2527986 RepID=A0A5C5ZA09_9BACT|nr:Anaerobic dimethyl sulfoxide reductase chain B [Planctomycetes bacterium CA13]
MSTTITENELRPLDWDPSNDQAFDLVGMLIGEQQQLTAVERFSKLHDAQLDETELADGPVQAKYYRSLVPATAPSENQQFAFEVDLDSCSGCKACVVACHTLNGLEDNETWRQVGTVTIGQTISEVPDTNTAALPVAIQHVTTACHHCEDPGCLSGCPVKAYEKDSVTGIVRHLDDQCIGCKYCTMMCPYEVPKYSKRLGIVRKCDMCHNRLSVGEAPACVQSCPNEAIRIRIVDRDAKHSTDPSDSLAPGAPSSSITNPTTVYLTSRGDQLGLPQDAGMDEVAESHWPLAALLVATQLSVGMLIGERVIAFGLWLSHSSMPLAITSVVATVALIVGGVGLNLAPLHLGQPLRSWRIFLGLRTSWLSREAVILGKYVGALTAAVGLLWLPMSQSYLPDSITELVAIYVPSWAGKLMLGISIPIGLMGLYCSAMIYIATKRQLWRHSRTLLRCGGTTIIGGIVFAVTAIVGTITLAEIDAAFITAFAMLGMVFSAIAATAKLVWERRVYLGNTRETDTPLDRRCRALTRNKLPKLRSLRLGSGVASVACTIVSTLVIGTLGASAWTTFAACVITSALVLASEGTERLLYFMSVVYDRMPGTLK